MKESAGKTDLGDKAIVGERLHLRRLDASDIDARYVAWHRDPERMRYYSGSSRDFSRQSLVDELERGLQSGTLFVYGIYTNAEDRCIGSIKIGPIQPAHRTSDLVTLIGDSDYVGKGLAAEAIRLGSRLAFTRHGIRKLVTGMFEQNEASIRAYVRAGWTIEGRLPGHYLVDGEPADRVLVGCFREA